MGHLTGLFALAVMLISASASAGGLTVAHPYPDGTAVDDWATAISGCIEGSVGIGASIYGEGQLGSANTLPTAVADGQVEIAIMPAVWMSTVWPAIEVLASPGIVTSPDDAMRLVRDTELLAEMDKLGSAEAGFHIVGLGWQYGAIIGHDLAPLDVSSSRIGTVSPSIAGFLDKLDATALRIPGSDASLALQFRAIDSAVISVARIDRMLVRQEPALSIAWSDDFTPFVSPLAVVLSVHAVRDWGDELLDGMRTGCVEANAAFNQNTLKAASEAIAAAGDSGIEIVEYGDRVRSNWLKTMDDALTESAERGRTIALVDRIRSTLRP